MAAGGRRPDALPAGLVGFSAGRRLQKLSSAPRALARLQFKETSTIQRTVAQNVKKIIHGIPMSNVIATSNTAQLVIDHPEDFKKYLHLTPPLPLPHLPLHHLLSMLVKTML